MLWYVLVYLKNIMTNSLLEYNRRPHTAITSVVVSYKHEKCQQ